MGPRGRSSLAGCRGRSQRPCPPEAKTPLLLFFRSLLEGEQGKGATVDHATGEAANPASKPNARAEKTLPGNGRTACCGSYQELSPRELGRRKELVVLLVKAAHGSTGFEGYRAVHLLDGTQSLPSHLSRLPPGQPPGIVCPDGDCSGRLAIRLSKLGYPVYHLGGGLREWYHGFREARAS